MSANKLLLGSLLTLAIGIVPAVAQDTSTTSTTTTTQSTDHNDTNSKTKKAITKAAGKTKDAAETTADKTKAAASATGEKMSGKHAAKVDINSATKEQLESIPAIGETYSQKIIDGRPYASKSELVSKDVVPQATYNEIKNDIRVGSSKSSKTAAHKTKKTTTTTTTSTTSEQQ